MLCREHASTVCCTYCTEGQNCPVYRIDSYSAQNSVQNKFILCTEQCTELNHTLHRTNPNGWQCLWDISVLCTEQVSIICGTSVLYTEEISAVCRTG